MSNDSGVLVPFQSNVFTEVLARHCIIRNNRSGQGMVYCPVGRILSFSSGDVEHKYCALCHVYFAEMCAICDHSPKQHSALFAACEQCLIASVDDPHHNFTRKAGRL